MTAQSQVDETFIHDPALMGNLADHVVARRGQHPFLHLDKKLPYASLGTTLTGHELLEFVNRVGNVLLAAGLRRGDRVAIYKTNAPDYFLLGLAIIKAGGIAVPIASNMSVADVTYYVGYTGASFLITDEPTYTSKQLASVEAFPQVTWVFPEAPAGFGPRHVDLAKSLPSASTTLAPAPLTHETPIYLAHTSGTTAFPKAIISVAGGFQISLEGVLKGTVPNFGVPFHRLETRIGYGLEYHHIVAQVLMSCALLGSSQIFTVSADFEADRTLRLIEREKIEYYATFPSEYESMYARGLENYDLSRVKIWWAASDAMHEVHMRAFAERGAPGCLFLDMLGTSEVGVPALVRAVSATTPLEARRLIGVPRPGGPSVRIADADGHDVPAGQVGRLWVKSPTLSRGYWNRHDLYFGAMNDGWFFTGDVACTDEQGRFYHLDRLPDVIRGRGGPTYSLLLEERLMMHPDIGDAAVIGVPHPEHEQAPIAVVCLRAGHTATGDEIRAWNNDIAGAQKLAAVFVVPPAAIPRGVTGKILKRVLRETYKTTFVAASSANVTTPAASPPG